MRDHNHNETLGRIFVGFVLVLMLCPFMELYRPIRHFVRDHMATDAPFVEKWSQCWDEARIRTKQAFRPQWTLQAWFSRIKFYGFGATTSDFVQQGRDGWLFFTPTEERRCMNHTHPFSKHELEAWAKVFESWRVVLAEKGAHFFVMIAPDKHTIYGDMSCVTQPPQTPNRMDQLYSYLAEHTGVRTIDVRPALLAQKSKHQLFYKTDTHWNSVGAFFAYQTVADRLRVIYPGIARLSLSDFALKEAEPNGMDLGRFAGLGDVLKESTQLLIPKIDPATHFEDVVAANMQNASLLISKINTENLSAAVPRLLMLRDSFTTALLPFVATLAQHGSFVWWWQLELEEVERTKPDVVLFELVERDLYSPNVKPQPL